MGLVVVNEYFAPAYLSALLNLLALIPLVWYAHTSRSLTRAACRRFGGGDPSIVTMRVVNLNEADGLGA